MAAILAGAGPQVTSAGPGSVIFVLQLHYSRRRGVLTAAILAGCGTTNHGQPRGALAPSSLRGGFIIPGNFVGGGGSTAATQPCPSCVCVWGGCLTAATQPYPGESSTISSHVEPSVASSDFR